MKRTEQVNLRLDEDLIDALERVAKEESLDRSTIIRRLLKDGLGRWRLEHSIRAYQGGEISLGRAAEESSLTQWDLMGVLRAANVSYPLSREGLEERLASLPQANPAATAFGYQTRMDWFGTQVLTLADIPPRDGILLVGINPAPASVAAGHYYQGRLGRRLWSRLERLGLLEKPVPGAEDESFARAGHGLTDIVKRPTGSAAELTHEEVAFGAERLRGLISKWEVGLILFPFKRAAVALLGTSSIRPGSGPEFGGHPTFLLSGPYAPRSDTERVDQQLAELRLHIWNA